MRPIIRCKRCNLNQYETSNGMCRRCGSPFVITRPEEFEARILNEACLVETSEPKNIVKWEGRALAEYRVALGLSQWDLTCKSGISRGTVSKLEHDKLNPTIGLLERLAESSGIPITWLVQEPNSERWNELYAVRMLLMVRELKLDLETVLRYFKRAAYLCVRKAG